jgi:thiamine biosynthesis lipoprotein
MAAETISDVLVPSMIRNRLPYRFSQVIDYRGESMGTDWSVRLVAEPAVRDWVKTHALATIGQILEDVIVQMSHWCGHSLLSRFNDAPPGSRHALPAAFFKVLSYGLAVADETSGAYNPAAGRLIDAWGFGANGRHAEPGFAVPSNAAIADCLNACDWRRLALDRAGRSILQPGGVRLDLSSIAKGYAVDAVANKLLSCGVRHFLVDIGGELRGEGVRPDGQPWWVDVEQPTPAWPSARIALHGLAVATSGDHRRFFHHDGRRHSHTIDPRNGWPITHGLAGVTVLHSECMAADALSTALMVLGPEAGLAYAERRALAARLTVRTGEVVRAWHTAAWAALLQ